jgi:hypothetical protein
VGVHNYEGERDLTASMPLPKETLRPRLPVIVEYTFSHIDFARALGYFHG